jgi:glycosyltransferase involved in cell wall biosynthesis
MKPRLIILNQLDLPFFSAWIKKWSPSEAGIEYWNSDVDPKEYPNLTIRKSPCYNRDSTLGRFIAWIRYTLICFWRLLWYPRKTPIFATTTPPIVVIMLWVMYKIKRHPYIVLEWDIYPQIASVMGMFSSRNPIYRVWYWLHGLALRDAKMVIAISDGMADVLREMAKRDIPLVVITNWADTDHFHPMERANSPFAQAQGITDQLVVSYSGNMGETHAIETILEVIKALNHRNDILFIINGTGSKRKLVEDAVASSQYPNLRLLGWIEDADYPDLLACIDVSFITLASGYERLSLPSKTYTALASGNVLLTISDEPSDLANLVRTHHCGENFTSAQVADMVAWIQALADDRDRLRAYQKASREAAITHFSEAVCTARLNEVIRAGLWG